MRHKLTYVLFFLIVACFSFHSVYAQEELASYIKQHYTKIERQIPMRDGVKLFTSIYIPKDESKKYPFLINRTPYTVAPYGEEFKTSLGPDSLFAKEGYIFVYQDVRGRWMSEGSFEDIRPHIANKKSKTAIDESSDTYDTIDWLLKNIPNNNGKAGIYGISYPGFYSTASLPGAHPALQAVSPQAPVTDWFRGDDFHHNGAFMLVDAFSFYSSFGVPRPKPITPDKATRVQTDIRDNYQFFLDLGPLKNVKKNYFGDSIRFWNQVTSHPDLDTFWRAREIVHHLKGVKPAVMVVGGNFDAEDQFGTYHTFKVLDSLSPKADNYFVVGPWFHGGWVRSDGSSFGDIVFNEPTSDYYQRNLELPFFNHYLKGKGSFDAAKVSIFVTGSNKWQHLDTWPPKEATSSRLYLQEGGKLSFNAPTAAESYDEYISDPNNPVPYQRGTNSRRSREYMIDDQRFASRRPDVMVYTTDVLQEDITLAGPLLAHLKVSTTGTDADYVVKLIDVYPADSPDPDPNPQNIVMSGYQMLLRGEVMRGKYRNSFEKPEPFVPGQLTEVNYALPDVAHTFKKGHKIMIQVQNSWFPLVDRNPQQFMDIFQADEGDFKKATQRIYHDAAHPSCLEIKVLAN
ncbi:CocE/NonD family hydrolase [Olivibacter sitiensis]|uniref:CocE/NonD family hydrolase n=1 Tax=Olivibacter sitiensis TaxID=376470 RepID=UPI0003FC4BF0|nr:CocE/NonD family hydrolase [Olivibacter sitiensis]